LFFLIPGKETLNYNHFERKGALLYACELEIIVSITFKMLIVKVSKLSIYM